MNEKEFEKNYKEINGYIKGHGRKVAERAGVTYGTYQSATRGQITNPKVLQKIYDSMLSYAKDRARQILER